MRGAICFLVILGSSLALPSSKVVDLPGTRIMGGHEVERHSVPYQVAVIRNGQVLCGGSLISTTAVLTVASCTLSASSVELRIGAHYYDLAESSQVRMTSTNIINHEDYNKVTHENDISLVILPSPVNLTSAIQVIPLAPSTSSSYDDASGYLTGWGFTETSTYSHFLMGVDLSIISNSDCAKYYGDIPDSSLCTWLFSSAELEITTGCTGDDGGPLVVDGVQVAVFSFVPGDCIFGLPARYTRVSSFREWIQKNAGV